MPKYRRAFVPGGTFFLTLVTYNRTPLFAKAENMTGLRSAVMTTKSEMPFEIEGAVVLPDHMHFLWTLPPDDTNYSRRVGRLKVLFTRALRGPRNLPQAVSNSRRKHRESDVWQRRFWEHTVRDEKDMKLHLDYIHYNPVKHGWVSCPHLWPHSSFHQWVKKKAYPENWCCMCHGESAQMPDFTNIADAVGE